MSRPPPVCNGSGAGYRTSRPTASANLGVVVVVVPHVPARGKPEIGAKSAAQSQTSVVEEVSLCPLKPPAQESEVIFCWAGGGVSGLESGLSVHCLTCWNLCTRGFGLAWTVRFLSTDLERVRGCRPTSLAPTKPPRTVMNNRGWHSTWVLPGNQDVPNLDDVDSLETAATQNYRPPARRDIALEVVAAVQPVVSGWVGVHERG